MINKVLSLKLERLNSDNLNDLLINIQEFELKKDLSTKNKIKLGK
jgi:hypothetical protein